MIYRTMLPDWMFWSVAGLTIAVLILSALQEREVQKRIRAARDKRKALAPSNDVAEMYKAVAYGDASEREMWMETARTMKG